MSDKKFLFTFLPQTIQPRRVRRRRVRTNRTLGILRRPMPPDAVSHYRWNDREGFGPPCPPKPKGKKHLPNGEYGGFLLYDGIWFPERDGAPMAENDMQGHWNKLLHGGILVLMRDRPDVYVASDLLWYPVKLSSRISVAPDVFVAFGVEDKPVRMRYAQWLENNVAPQVVIEVLSSSNKTPELERKFRFYDKYGVEEYYIYDPFAVELWGWLRGVRNKLVPIPEMNGWVSPRLGIRFVLPPDKSFENQMIVERPDGEPFRSYESVFASEQRLKQERELVQIALEQEANAREHAEAEVERMEQDVQRAEGERQRAEAERDAERQARLRLEERLRALGISLEEA